MKYLQKVKKRVVGLTDWRGTVRPEGEHEMILKLNDDSFVRLDALRKAGGYSDFSLFVTDAIGAFEWMLEEAARGGAISAVSPGGKIVATLELRNQRRQRGC